MSVRTYREKEREEGGEETERTRQSKIVRERERERERERARDRESHRETMTNSQRVPEITRENEHEQLIYI